LNWKKDKPKLTSLDQDCIHTYLVFHLNKNYYGYCFCYYYMDEWMEEQSGQPIYNVIKWIELK
jgi:hypothetical protein